MNGFQARIRSVMELFRLIELVTYELRYPFLVCGSMEVGVAGGISGMFEELAQGAQPNDEVVYNDVRTIVEAGRAKVAVAANSAMVEAYWQIGKRIFDEVGDRAAYGRHLLAFLSERLTAEYGRGFTVRNLRNMRQFYCSFPIRHALRAELSWTHYRVLMTCDTQEERDWYMNTAAEEGWSTRELEHQVQTRSYWRLLSTQKKAVGFPDSKSEESSVRRPSPEDILKDPYIFDFLPEPPRKESDLEQALINSLSRFLMELGRGFTFYARQKRISFEDEDYYIDLVFYNYEMDCFVLIDLKAHAVTPQDVGQMDFYVRVFDDLYKPERGNPTIGLVIGTKKGAAVARYTNLADKNNLYAAGYLDHLPSEEDLERVLERNRREFERAAKARELP